MTEPEASPAAFVNRNLRGATFRSCDLSGAVLRAVDVADAEIDAPWLLDGRSTLLVNGVDVVPYVVAELDRRFPGRALKRADSPAGLRDAWAALESAWAGAVERATSMPAGTVDVSVDGEWSFAQTLRHLVMATDTWLRRGILGIEQPYHPLGQADDSFAADGNDASVFAEGIPPFDDVLQVRAERAAMVRDLIASVTPEQLAEERRNPHDPAYPETVLSCLHTILEEEWEHLRYALRDLDALESAPPPA